MVCHSYSMLNIRWYRWAHIKGPRSIGWESGSINKVSMNRVTSNTQKQFLPINQMNFDLINK